MWQARPGEMHAFNKQHSASRLNVADDSTKECDFVKKGIMNTTGQTSFDTPLGPATIRFTSRGIRSLTLHDVGRKHQVKPGEEGDVPDWVRDIVLRVQAHLGGTLQDFSQVPLDIEGITPFYREVYEASRKIPSGKTVTYGELAKVVGRPAAARAVGQALSKNPILLIVPCHRIVGSTGNAVGFSAPGGVKTKAHMLAVEGARIPRVSRN
jgi:methylated-DNA-[protein]-cysteine S-methyltransferase